MAFVLWPFYPRMSCKIPVSVHTCWPNSWVIFKPSNILGYFIFKLLRKKKKTLPTDTLIKVPIILSVKEKKKKKRFPLFFRKKKKLELGALNLTHEKKGALNLCYKSPVLLIKKNRVLFYSKSNIQIIKPNFGPLAT